MPNEYYVTKNGVPCVLSKEIALHFKGLLKPCELHEEPHVFGLNYSAGKLKAERAIERTVAAAKEIHGSLIGEWDKVQWLAQPGTFEIQKRKIAAPVETETLA